MTMRGRGAIAGVLFITALFLCLAVVRAVRPRTLAHVEGRPLTAPVGERGHIAWLEGSSEEARLVALRGRHRTVLLERAWLSGLAVGGKTAYVSASEEDGEKLLRLDLSTGKAEAIARLPRKADDIAQGEGWVVWRETRGGDLSDAPFVVAAEALTMVRAREDEGSPSTVAVLHGGADGLWHVRLLGVAEGRVYWLERQEGPTATTLVRRVSLPAGDPETVTSEAGMRSAALGDGKLVWTAPSREAAEPGTFAAVLERPLEGGATRAIGDWVGARAELAASGEAVYSQERTRVWRFRGELGEQQSLGPAVPGAAFTGIIDDSEYAIVSSGKGYALVRRPLTWGARIRGLLP